MKHLTLLSFFGVLALLLSSCGLHTGLGQTLGLGSASKSTASTLAVKTAATKHAKATLTASAGGGSQGSNSFTITSSGFQPPTLTVKVGTSVTWTNHDTAAQGVTSDTANLFDSGLLDSGGTFQYTFAQAGTFTFHSTNAPDEAGIVLVTP